MISCPYFIPSIKYNAAECHQFLYKTFVKALSAIAGCILVHRKGKRSSSCVSRFKMSCMTCYILINVVITFSTGDRFKPYLWWNFKSKQWLGNLGASDGFSPVRACDNDAQ